MQVMGKTGRWIRYFLTGKKDKEKEINSASNGGAYEHCPAATPISIPQPTTPKEKRRWSFRRSSAAPPGRQDVMGPADNGAAGDHQVENGSKKQDALAAPAKAADAAIQLTAAADTECGGGASAVEEAAAVKIQSVFRAYLARKALNALKGLVKLQALVRGHLVRKHATATLRCMQALVTVQARALAQRIRMAQQIKHNNIDHQTQYNPRKSTHQYHYSFTNSSNQDYVDRSCAEENIKIVEMDLGGYKPVAKARSSCSNHTQSDRTEHTRTSIIKQENNHQISPSPSSAITDIISPRTCSNHFEDYSFHTAQSSPQCYSATSKPDPAAARIPFPYPRSDYAAESMYNEYPPFHPNYMANTESSRAKSRSHSAPKQRTVETTLIERQPSSRRRPSVEGRNVPRAVRMERSSSHLGSGTAPSHQYYPWCVKLDKSTVSLKDSECGSTSTVLTNTNYFRSLVGFEVQGARY